MNIKYLIHCSLPEMTRLRALSEIPVSWFSGKQKIEFKNGLVFGALTWDGNNWHQDELNSNDLNKFTIETNIKVDVSKQLIWLPIGTIFTVMKDGHGCSVSIYGTRKDNPSFQGRWNATIQNLNRTPFEVEEV